MKTIEKAMKKIETEEVKNQIVRWTLTKETHATEIQTIVSQYFLTQRIKEDRKDYTQNLKYLHRMLVIAMKCKQTTDLKYTKQLKKLVDNFGHLYLNKHIGEGSH